MLRYKVVSLENFSEVINTLDGIQMATLSKDMPTECIG
jgi:hypothetical protein